VADRAAVPSPPHQWVATTALEFGDQATLSKFRFGNQIDMVILALTHGEIDPEYLGIVEDIAPSTVIPIGKLICELVAASSELGDGLIALTALRLFIQRVF
jgi:hypothetical protein